MALQSFDRFMELKPETRIQIWQQAIVNEGPRIVEIKYCQHDHIRGRCYIASHNNVHALGSDCCFHWKNPLMQQKPALCRCIESHGHPSSAPTLCYKHNDLQEDVFDVARECPDCLGYSGNESLNTGGHKLVGNYHFCRRQNSKLSPLLWTCSESRYEVQRLGMLKYYRGIKDLKDAPEGYPEVTPIYFNFGVDTLAINMDDVGDWLSWNAEMKNLDKVTSLILVDPKSRSTYTVGALWWRLGFFPNLENLDIVMRESEGWTGPLRLCDLGRGIRGADEDKFRTVFEVMMEQVNWCRRAEGITPVQTSNLVCMERTENADIEWDDDDEGNDSHTFADWFRRCWLDPDGPQASRVRMRKYKDAWKVPELEGELEGLISNWKERLEKDAPYVLKWDERKDWDTDSMLDY